MTDWGDLYRANVAAIAALAGDLSSAELATPVPATPAWTVRDLLGHLAGAPADAVAGRMEEAPGPAWTARHVAERSGRAVGDLVEEMRDNQDAVADSAAESPSPAIVWDIAVHHADLHEALGRGVLPDDLWLPVLGAIAPRTFGAAGIPAEVDPYEAFRAVFSRRSRTQMATWGLSLSPEQLDELCIFGPREDDQPVP